MPAEEQRPQWDALAADCLAALREGAPWREMATGLARAAVDPATAAAASQALFAGVVEPLADSFDPEQATAYTQFFEHVLGVAGFEGAVQHPSAAPVEARVELDRVRRVVVLSRVTLGADIAVSSVFLRMALDLPSQPEVVFAAGAKNLALFAGESRVEPLELTYPRGGTLAERLGICRQARRAIEELSRDLKAGELLVLDPDSRITQLGLLPVAPPVQHYLFFDSRSYRDGEPGPLGAIAAEWLEERLGPREAPPLPWLALPAADFARARDLRRQTEGKLAAVNFGVGGNAAKRVADPFEAEAVRLLIERGYHVVADAGAGEEERARAKLLVASSLHEDSFASFAAVIGVSDLFVGYDSGAAHAAAALGVRAIDVFAGAPSETMRSRWSPWGKRPALVLPVDADEAPENVLWRLGELLR